MAMEWLSFANEEAVQALFGGADSPEENPILILKHSNRCMISSMIKNRVESQPDSRISYYLIEVNSERHLSNFLELITHVQHESPQSFLLVDGKLADYRSHSAFNSSEIGRLLDKEAKT